MRLFRLLVALMSVACSSADRLEAAAGTDQLAEPGRDANVHPGWPEGTAALVNDPLRTDGWNDWFSDWPSDVGHYEYKIRDMRDVNALVEKLAAVAEHEGEIVLSPLKEPRGLGWVTSLPEGNGTAVLLSVGDQKRVDQWFQRLPDGKFGVMQFTACPVAVPPTLTIFVGNPLIDVTQLSVPDNVTVTEGQLPRYFKTWNRKIEPEKPDGAKPTTAVAKPVSPEVQRATEAIKSFLDRRGTKSAADGK